MILLKLDKALGSTVESTSSLKPALSNLVLVSGLLEELRSILKLGSLVEERKFGQSGLSLHMNSLQRKYLFHKLVALLVGHSKFVFTKMQRLLYLADFWNSRLS